MSRIAPPNAVDVLAQEPAERVSGCRVAAAGRIVTLTVGGQRARLDDVPVLERSRATGW